MGLTESTASTESIQQTADLLADFSAGVFGPKSKEPDQETIIRFDLPTLNEVLITPMVVAQHLRKLNVKKSSG